MNTYMNERLKAQAIKACYELLADVLKSNELKHMKITFKNGKINYEAPQHILDKIKHFQDGS